MSEAAYVYVIGHATGPQKVGFSGNPWTRVRALKVAGEPHLTVHHASAVSVDNVQGVEDLAHWILDDHALGHEMFAVKPETAASAVQDAVVRYMAGERAPRPRPGEENVKISLSLTESTIDLVDEWRRVQPDNPNRSEAVRRMIQLGAEPRPRRPPSSS